MVRHEQSERAEPMLLLIVEPNVIQYGLTDSVFTKVILTSRFGANSHEIIGIGGNPMRSFVVEVFAQCHAEMMPLW